MKYLVFDNHILGITAKRCVLIFLTSCKNHRLCSQLLKLLESFKSIYTLS